MTAQEAASLSGHDVYLPQSGLVVGPPEVWYDPVTNSVGVRYGGDLLIEFARWGSGDDDPATEYATKVRENGAGQATEIAGHPAFVMPAGAQEGGYPRLPVVMVTIGRLNVTLIGRFSAEELVDIAASLEVAAAA
jgi:hypothetical protein